MIISCHADLRKCNVRAQFTHGGRNFETVYGWDKNFKSHNATMETPSNEETSQLTPRYRENVFVNHNNVNFRVVEDDVRELLSGTREIVRFARYGINNFVGIGLFLSRSRNDDIIELFTDYEKTEYTECRLIE